MKFTVGVPPFPRSRTSGRRRAFCLAFAFFFRACLPAGEADAGGAVPEAPAPSAGAAVPDPIQQALERAESDWERLRGEERGERGGGWSWSDSLAVVALVAALGLMVWAARWSRGLSPFRGAGGREMKLLDRMAVGRQSSLLVVRLRDRDYWLADHAQGVTLLAELPAPVPPPDPPEAPAPPSATEA